MSYVDLHLHLLPGVDDGAPDMETSLAYARRLVDEGVEEVTVTPHVSREWPLDVLEIPERVHELQAEVDAERLGLVVRSGGELHPDRATDLTAPELAVVTHGPRGAEWVLLEAPFTGIDDAFLSTCRALRERGVGLVIAHPERAAGLLDEGLDRMHGELAAGAVLQVNVCSLLGNHGGQVRETAARLVRDGLACVLASDAHPGSRDHTLRLGFELALEAGASSVHAWRLTHANPRFLLRHGIPRVTAAGAGVALSR